jgi:hypothetical protein
MTLKGKMTAAAAAWAVLAAGTAHASATTCWSPVEEAAAKVRNLQTRLMVATLHCQLVGSDITPAYNNFVRVNRTTLQAANSVLRTRLGERAYDSFVTLIANLSAGSMADAEQCAIAAEVAGAGEGAGGDVQKLVALEERLEAPLDLPGGACPVTFTLAAAPASAAVTAPPVAAARVTAPVSAHLKAELEAEAEAEAAAEVPIDAEVAGPGWIPADRSLPRGPAMPAPEGN